MKKIKKISKSKFLKWVIIPLILLVIWMGGLLYEAVKNDTSFAVISQSLDISSFNQVTEQEIHAGENVGASFYAENNYLGIVSVRFNTFERINEDTVVFRIREDGAEKWYYEGEYTVGQFQPHGLFTFGFPVISDSKGKKYVFEIESKAGVKGDAVAISSIEPVIVAKFQFPRGIITNSPLQAATFLINKIHGLITNQTFVFSSLIYLLPFLYYVLWNLFHLKFKDKKIYVAFLPVIFMLIDIIFINKYLYLTYIIIIIISLTWILSVITYKFDSSVSYLLATFFLILCMVSLLIQQSYFAEKFAMWVYILLVIGVIQGLIEYKTGKDNNINYKKVLSYIGVKASKSK